MTWREEVKGVILAWFEDVGYHKPRNELEALSDEELVRELDENYSGGVVDFLTSLLRGNVLLQYMTVYNAYPKKRVHHNVDLDVAYDIQNSIENMDDNVVVDVIDLKNGKAYMRLRRPDKEVIKERNAYRRTIKD